MRPKYNDLLPDSNNW